MESKHFSRYSGKYIEIADLAVLRPQVNCMQQQQPLLSHRNPLYQGVQEKYISWKCRKAGDYRQVGEEVGKNNMVPDQLQKYKYALKHIEMDRYLGMPVLVYKCKFSSSAHWEGLEEIIPQQ